MLLPFGSYPHPPLPLAKAQVLPFLAHFHTIQQRSRIWCMVTCCFLWWRGGTSGITLCYNRGGKELHESQAGRGGTWVKRMLSYSFIHLFTHSYNGPVLSTYRAGCLEDLNMINTPVLPSGSSQNQLLTLQCTHRMTEGLPLKPPFPHLWWKDPTHSHPTSQQFN